MRLWTIHPAYLDTKGLLALWREGLLAQKVLLGETRGYKNHPQLLRFKQTGHPCGAIASYLRTVCSEAEQRGFAFDRSKISRRRFSGDIRVTRGQVRYEFDHLLNKLARRSPDLHAQLVATRDIRIHPLFQPVNGKVETWEIIS